jgi:hypothetical protein
MGRNVSASSQGDPTPRPARGGTFLGVNPTERPFMSQSILKAAAGVAALAAIAFGASAIASGNKSSTASVAGPGAPAQGMNGGPPPGMNGAPPAGGMGGPGGGTAVTGSAAAKVKAAALAKYPGTIERIEQAPDGSYVAHVIRSGGELHVLVNKQFVVTGTATGPPGRSGRPGSTGASGKSS